MTLNDWIEEFRDMLRRRRGLIAAVVILGTVFSVLFALSEAHYYRSVAILQVQGAQVDDDIAPAASSSMSARQLQIVEQQVMSHDGILEIGRDLGLLDDLAGLTETEQVALLREAVEVEGVAAARAGPREDGAISLVRISAEWTDRASAQALADEIVRRTLVRSRSLKLDRARETLAFFTEREKKLDARIARLEEELAVFRRENDLADAITRESRQRRIETLRTEVLSLDRQIMEIEQQLDRNAGETGLSLVEQRQREQAMTRLTDLAEQRAFLAEQLDSTARGGQTDPAIDIRLAKYESDLANLRAERGEVSEHRKTAEIQYQLESGGQSARFRVLEEASWPDYSSTPSRKKMALAGTLASIAAALAMAFLLDLRTPVLRSAALMQRDLGFGPIVTIPEAREERRRSLLGRIFGRRQARPGHVS